MGINCTESGYPEHILKYSTVKYLQRRIARACEKLPTRFEGVDQWEKYKRELVREIRKRLPVWEPEIIQDDRKVSCIQLGEGLVHETIDVNVDGGYYTPVHIYRMEALRNRVPAILVCPGYAHFKNSEDIIGLCIALAKKGFVAAAVEYGGLGECADRPDVVTSIDNVTALAFILGISDIGLRVMHNLSTLRYLKQRSDVDVDRIGITGLCQGSIVLWYTAAICDEFHAIAPVCGTTTLEAEALEYVNRQGGWSGASPFLYDHLAIGDIQHIFGCFAPRPLYVQNNIMDIHWPMSGLQKIKEMTENIYGLYGAAEQQKFRLEHEKHAFTGVFADNLVNWFSKVLLSGGVK
jgi:dienelactone hydrolase